MCVLAIEIKIKWKSKWMKNNKEKYGKENDISEAEKITLKTTFLAWSVLFIFQAVLRSAAV